MKTDIVRLLFAIALVTGCAASGNVRVTGSTVVVTKEPPQPRSDKPSVARPNHIWVKGRWHWDDRVGSWQWLDGRWERQRSGHRWREGRWERHDREWHWIEGTWVVSVDDGRDRLDDRREDKRDDRRDDPPPPDGDPCKYEKANP